MNSIKKIHYATAFSLIKLSQAFTFNRCGVHANKNFPLNINKKNEKIQRELEAKI
jgi:hypothetical protein